MCLFIFGGAGVLKDEHPSEAPVSPSNAVSISSSGILSMLNGFLLALMMRVAHLELSLNGLLRLAVAGKAGVNDYIHTESSSPIFITHRPHLPPAAR